MICKPTQLSNNAGSEVAAGLSQPDQVLEDSGWAGSSPSCRREGGQVWLMSCSFCTRRGAGLKGPAQCHVHAGVEDLTVTLAFSGFAGDCKVDIVG